MGILDISTIMKPRIRELTAEHYGSVRAIFTDEFYSKGDIPYSYLQEAWRYRAREMSLGAFNNEGDLVGFIVTYDHYIAFIAVHSYFQNMNIGTMLLKNVLKQCILENHYVYLWPLSLDKRLVNWYRSHGFNATHDGHMVFHTYNTRMHSKHLSI